MEFLEFMDQLDLNHWNWFVIALVLLGLEMALPGVVFMWMAIASAIVGGIVFITPELGWEYQFINFAILSIISVVAGRKYLKRNPIVSEDSTLNKRADQYVGQVFALIRDMENGRGRVRIGDSNWSVEGDFEAKESDKVKVIGTNVTILKVEKV